MDRNVFLKENLEGGKNPLIGNIIVINRNGEQVNIDNHSNEMKNIMNGLAFLSMKDATDEIKSYSNYKDEFGSIISDPHKHSYKKLLTRGGSYRSDIINNLKFSPDPATLIINSIIINKNDGEMIIEHTRLNTSVSSDVNNIIERVPIKTTNHSDIQNVLNEVVDKMKSNFNNPRGAIKSVIKYIDNSKIGTKKSDSNKNVLGWE